MNIDEIRKKAESSFSWFCEHVLEDSATTPFHRKIERHISTSFQAPEKVTGLLAPRGHAKTTKGSVYLPIWLPIAKTNPLGPNICQLVTHGINETAKRIIGSQQDILIQKGDLLHRLWPHVFWKKPEKEARDWKAESFSVKRKVVDKASTVQVNGMTGTQAGLHFDLIIGDDLVNDQNYKTPGQLEATIDCIKDQMNLLRGERARYHFYGTIWNYNDASGWLLNTPELASRIRFLVLSCYDEMGAPVWPKERSAEFLEGQKAILGSTKFAQQYLNQRLPDGTAVFQEKDIQRYRQEWLDDRLVLPGMLDQDNPRAYNFFLATDTNTRESTAHDAAVLLLCAMDDAGDVWVVDIKRWYPSPSVFQAEEKAMVLKWKPMRTFHETVGAQIKDVHYLQQDQVLNGTPYNIYPVPRPPIRKFDRICPVLQPFVEALKFHVPIGSKFDCIIDEMRGYSVAASQDDILDCIADTVQYGVKPPKPIKAVEPPKSQFLIDAMLGLNRRSLAPWGPISDTLTAWR